SVSTRHVSIVDTARFGSSVSDWPPPTIPTRSLPPRFGVAASARLPEPRIPAEPRAIPAAVAFCRRRLRVSPPEESCCAAMGLLSLEEGPDRRLVLCAVQVAAIGCSAGESRGRGWWLRHGAGSPR